MTLAELIAEWEAVAPDPTSIMNFCMRIPPELMQKFTEWAMRRRDQPRAIVNEDPDRLN